jgi:hypothetical protein
LGSRPVGRRLPRLERRIVKPIVGALVEIRRLIGHFIEI